MKSLSMPPRASLSGVTANRALQLKQLKLHGVYMLVTDKMTLTMLIGRLSVRY